MYEIALEFPSILRVSGNPGVHSPTPPHPALRRWKVVDDSRDLLPQSRTSFVY